MKTERVLYVQNITLHSHTVYWIQAVIFPCLFSHFVKWFKSEYALSPLLNFFSHLSSLVFPHQLPLLKMEGQKSLLKLLISKLTQFHPNVCTPMCYHSEGCTHAGTRLPSLCSHPQRCSKDLSSFTGHPGSYPLIPTKLHEHHDYIPCLPKHLSMN